MLRNNFYMSRIIKGPEKDDTIREFKQFIRKGYMPKERGSPQFRKIFDKLALSYEELKGKRRTNNLSRKFVRHCNH